VKESVQDLLGADVLLEEVGEGLDGLGVEEEHGERPEVLALDHEAGQVALLVPRRLHPHRHTERHRLQPLLARVTVAAALMTVIVAWVPSQYLPLIIYLFSYNEILVRTDILRIHSHSNI
jgi:hypothetical protein